MSEWFQAIVDKDATEQEAPALAGKIHQWLVLDGVVVAEPSDCLLGSDAGYCPGPHYEKAVTEPYGALLDLRHNGLEIITTRTVFFCLQGPLYLIC